MIKETMLKQTLYVCFYYLFIIITLIMLNQYVYETQNLITVVNSAINGKIHTIIPSKGYNKGIKRN